MVRWFVALWHHPLSRPARSDLAVEQSDVGRRALAIAVVVAACLIIALATGLVARPSAGSPRVPGASPVSAVLSYALTWRDPADDPPVTLPSGLAVKSSNYRGVAVDGVTYYYNLAPRLSFDPLARGDVTANQIDVVAVVGDPPNRVMIYTLRPGVQLSPR